MPLGLLRIMKSRPGYRSSTTIFILLLLTFLFLQVCKAYAQPTVIVVETNIWSQAKPTSEQLSSVIAETEKQLGEIPKDTLESSVQGQQRAVLKERVALILEWRSLIEQIQILNGKTKATVEEQQRLHATLDIEVKKVPSVPTKNPTPEGLQELQEVLTLSARALEEVHNYIKKTP